MHHDSPGIAVAGCRLGGPGTGRRGGGGAGRRSPVRAPATAPRRLLPTGGGHAGGGPGAVRPRRGRPGGRIPPAGRAARSPVLLPGGHRRGLGRPGGAVGDIIISANGSPTPDVYVLRRALEYSPGGYARL